MHTNVFQKSFLWRWRKIPAHLSSSITGLLVTTFRIVKMGLLRNSCPLALAVGACRPHLCMGSHVYACSACCHRGFSIMERIFLTCHRSNMSNPHSCGHKSTAAARMKHKCGMSLQSGTCVSVLSGDFCSQKATTLARQYQSRHFGMSQPNAPGRFGRKTQARFQCLPVKIRSYSRQQVQSDQT